MKLEISYKGKINLSLTHTNVEAKQYIANHSGLQMRSKT